MDGIKERSDRFVDQCSASVGGTLDIFVGILFSFQEIRANKIVALRVFTPQRRCPVLTSHRSACLRF